MALQRFCHHAIRGLIVVEGLGSQDLFCRETPLCHPRQKAVQPLTVPVETAVANGGQDQAAGPDTAAHQLTGHPPCPIEVLPHKAEPPAFRQIGVEGDAGDTGIRQFLHPPADGGVVEDADGEPFRPLPDHLIQQLHRLLGQLRPAAALEDPHMLRRQLLLRLSDALLDLFLKLASPVGQQDPQCQRADSAVLLPAVCLPGGDIAGLGHGGLHPSPHSLADIGAVVQDPVNGPPGYPRHLGDLLDGHPFPHADASSFCNRISVHCTGCLYCIGGGRLCQSGKNSL